jgi:DNA-binding NarL/FixJ family response regulator
LSTITQSCGEACGRSSKATRAGRCAAKRPPDATRSSKAGNFGPMFVVMDLSLPELNGLDATRQILKDGPGIEVLVLTMHHSEELAGDALRAGHARTS